MNILYSRPDPIYVRIYRAANRIIYWPLRQIKNIWCRNAVTWVGHGLVTAGCVYLGAKLGGIWGAWAGFVVGGTFYAARETLGQLNPTKGQWDHFGDVEGPIVIGSLMLTVALTFLL